MSLLKNADPEVIKDTLYIETDEEFERYMTNPQEFLEEAEVSEVIDSLLNISVRSQDYYEGAYLHVGMPSISIDFESGQVGMEGSEKVLARGRALQKALKDAGLPHELGVVSDCWYNG